MSKPSQRQPHKRGPSSQSAASNVALEDVEKALRSLRGVSPPVAERLELVLHDTTSLEHGKDLEPVVTDFLGSSVSQAFVNEETDPPIWGNAPGHTVLTSSKEEASTKDRLAVVERALVEMRREQENRFQLQRREQENRFQLQQYVIDDLGRRNDIVSTDIRNRYISVFVRAILEIPTQSDYQAIRKGNAWAHDGDAQHDILLWDSGIRTDHETYERLYGFSIEAVHVHWYSDRSMLALMNLHAAVRMTPVGTDLILQTLAPKFITAFALVYTVLNRNPIPSAELLADGYPNKRVPEAFWKAFHAGAAYKKRVGELEVLKFQRRKEQEKS